MFVKLDDLSVKFALVPIDAGILPAFIAMQRLQRLAGRPQRSSKIDKCDVY
jgi:enoyl-CoA hydratase/carnithine racemase